MAISASSGCRLEIFELMINKCAVFGTDGSKQHVIGIPGKI